MEPVFEAKAFLKHKLKASGPHGVHSPFVYNLITQILIPERVYYCFEEIENYRKKLLSDHRIIEVEDLGAGSRGLKTDKRMVSKIATHSLQPTSSAQALFRLAEHLQPATVLELGTSLGITTTYLSKATKAEIHTIEGSANVASVAAEVFSHFKCDNVKLHIGSFEKILPQIVDNIKSPAFVLIDGDHRFEPTLKYFEIILPHLNDQSAVILDDIHWSSEMECAWMEIIGRKEIILSMDFFHFGVIMFRKDRVKEHFVLQLP